MSRVSRIEIDSKEKNAQSKVLQNKLKKLGYNIEVEISKVYTLNYSFSEDELEIISSSLFNPVVETVRVDEPSDRKFDYALELGFLPGVTDNVATTTTEIIEDLLKIELGRNKVFTTKLIFIKGKISEDEVKEIALELINDLIERYHIKTFDSYTKDSGMDKIVPTVKLSAKQEAIKVHLDISDEELADIGKKGILDPATGERRGPLALDLDYLKTIQAYFKNERRFPTDIELESIAQTWSEHCKHTIFSSEIDDIKEGIFNKFIRGATKQVRKDLGKDDFCLSVFKDNSGAIVFDDNYMVTDKAETHNSPSALDPFGGAITGIVGVNRDTLGFGMGAKPIANKYGFCVGRPEDVDVIFRGKDKKNPALTPRKILDGVVHGVNEGGNCSGIPTPLGSLYFDDSYKGKPLIFVGTVGIMPRKLPNGSSGEDKKAMPNDNIVIIGGRVGKDGIHGATFSSEAMDEGSPATAVQIGDPITQKKLSDAIVREARDKGLYNSVTDNGAGGISCSVAEMAEECGGFIVDLEKVPLKYPGLQPWEIWISESQERMTLSVPDKSLSDFMELMEERGVEAVVIGKFNDSDRAIVNFNGEKIFDLDMNFLHNGLPKKTLKTMPYAHNTKEPVLQIDNHQELFEKILGSHNNCSYEYISRQYDHEVQANSVIKPLVGKGRVNGNASAIKPLFNSDKGVVMSQVMFPRLSEISTYDMAACSIDSAIRNTVAIGGNVDHMALLDNFCWCSSNDPERLYQLKYAAKGCYDYGVAFRTPFISGKDSMFNDFKGFDENNIPIKISVLPTLMISTLGVIDDVKKTCTMDFKMPGDLIYVIGETFDECGGSELYHVYQEIGRNIPKVDAKKARLLYQKVYELHQKNTFSACSSIEKGGFVIALAKMAIAGKLGCEVDATLLPHEKLNLHKILYSETQSRFIVTINPDKKKEFEKAMKNFKMAQVGIVSDKEDFIVSMGDDTVIESYVKALDKTYKERFEDF